MYINKVQDNSKEEKNSNIMNERRFYKGRNVSTSIHSDNGNGDWKNYNNTNGSVRWFQDINEDDNNYQFNFNNSNDNGDEDISLNDDSQDLSFNDPETITFNTDELNDKIANESQNVNTDNKIDNNLIEFNNNSNNNNNNIENEVSKNDTINGKGNLTSLVSSSTNNNNSEIDSNISINSSNSTSKIEKANNQGYTSNNFYIGLSIYGFVILIVSMLIFIFIKRLNYKDNSNEKKLTTEYKNSTNTSNKY